MNAIINRNNNTLLQVLLAVFVFLSGVLHAENITSQNVLENSDSEHNISGQIELVGKQASKAKISDVIVYFEPEKPIELKPLSSPYSLKMKNKAYQPRVSAIPVGTKIQISNHDSILHNAFSPSRSNKFDLGLYGKSEGKIHRFDSAGVVRIFCNVHYHMVAYVLVLDTPYYTKVDSNGEFLLSGLPPGKGKLYIWHERSKRLIKKIELPFTDPLAIELAITKRRIPEHKNKKGTSYKKKRRRRKY